MNTTIKAIAKRINKIMYSIIRLFQSLIKPATGKHSFTSSMMTSNIAIIGFDHPEKLAHGQCPYCKARIYLWISEDGIELHKLTDR